MQIAKQAFVDTNVLVYALYSDSPFHTASRALLDRVQTDESLTFCLSSQILSEFYAIVTNPKRVSEVQSSEKALGAVEALLALQRVTLLPITGETVVAWMKLARHHAPQGANIFDLQIAATMLVHGVSEIYTFNRRHFEKFDGIKVLAP
ncbi:PIN domain-containing protein [Candidatus Uhrbacteria bacterium]|nr:PIN domain-containing protein [Candidatus Uhrbacteria bacterium]